MLKGTDCLAEVLKESGINFTPEYKFQRSLSATQAFCKPMGGTPQAELIQTQISGTRVLGETRRSWQVNINLVLIKKINHVYLRAA